MKMSNGILMCMLKRWTATQSGIVNCAARFPLNEVILVLGFVSLGSSGGDGALGDSNSKTETEKVLLKCVIL